MSLDFNSPNNQINKSGISEIADMTELDNNQAQRSKTKQNPNKSDSQQDSYELEYNHDENEEKQERNKDNSVSCDTRQRVNRRNTVESYQGKYKKMNSGKYLYKSQTQAQGNAFPSQQPVVHAEVTKESNMKKQSLLNNKRKLSFFDNDFINTFKKFIFEINIKDEEKRLKRKKRLMNLNSLNGYNGSQSLNHLLGNIYNDSKTNDSNLSISKEHQKQLIKQIEEIKIAYFERAFMHQQNNIGAAIFIKHFQKHYISQLSSIEMKNNDGAVKIEKSQSKQDDSQVNIESIQQQEPVQKNLSFVPNTNQNANANANSNPSNSLLQCQNQNVNQSDLFNLSKMTQSQLKWASNLIDKLLISKAEADKNKQ